MCIWRRKASRLLHLVTTLSFHPSRSTCPGVVYRIVEGFYFKFGNSYVGSRWYRLDQSDYSIIVSLWGHHDPTPTQFAAGCTIPSL